MGLLDEYGVDLTEIQAPSYEIPDDTYEFVVSDIYVRKGSEKKPDMSWVNIEYQVGSEGKTYTEWFTLPENASAPTEDELKKLGWYKQRILSLGIPEDKINSFSREEVVGTQGVLTLRTKNGWQNIKSLRVENLPDTQEEAPAPAKKAPAAKSEAAKPATSKPAVAATSVNNPFA